MICIQDVFLDKLKWLECWQSKINEKNGNSCKIAKLQIAICILLWRNDNSRMPSIIDIGKRCSILLTMTPIKISLHYLPFMASELVSIIDSSCHFHTPKHTWQWSFKFTRCANSLHLVIWTYQRKKEVLIWIVKHNELDRFMSDTVNVR